MIRGKYELNALYMMKKIHYGEPKPTKMILTLADRSITYPYRVLEDVLVKFDNLLFLVDFVIKMQKHLYYWEDLF